MGEIWHIGVIGGSGLYDADMLEESQQIAVKSSFGEPSGPITTGFIGNTRFTFIARHGAGHRLPPDRVDYRANIDVLKRSGVSDVLAISSVGSLREDLEPGQFVAIDQFIDLTHCRSRSFFDTGCVAHVSMADPVCQRLSRLGASAVEAAGGAVCAGATYIAVEGPQFVTRAESRLYREWRADVIGMTGMPEARLAREAELPYALLGMVTDHDSWRDAEGVQAADILVAVKSNADLARATLTHLSAALPATRKSSPIDTALDGAIVTAAESRDSRLVARLDAVAGRVLR